MISGLGPYLFGELSWENRYCKQSERYLWMLDICLISKFRGKIQVLNKIWFQQDVATIHIQPMLWWAIWGKSFLWQWHFALTASLWLSFEDIISNEYTNKPLTLEELRETKWLFSYRMTISAFYLVSQNQQGWIWINKHVWNLNNFEPNQVTRIYSITE